MSETEWAVYDHPAMLLSYLNAEPYSRKVLHYALALANIHPAWLGSYQWERWKAAANAVLDDGCAATSLEALRDPLETEFDAIAQLERSPETRAFDAEFCDVVLGVWRRDGWWEDVIGFNVLPATLGPVRRAAAAILRDIFGNPFRPVAFAPEWRTGTAVTLARTMYDQRDFSGMPILADALQDAGCDHPDVLAHCRDTSLSHVRGCWVVGGVLGKQ